MPRPSYSFIFYHPNNIGWGVQIIKILTMLLRPLLFYIVLLGTNILFSSQFRISLSLRSWPSFAPIQTTSKIIFLYISIFVFWVTKLEDKRFLTEWYQAFRDFNLFLISSWIEFCFVRIVPKYMNSSSRSMELLPIFVLWHRPSFWSRDVTMYLALSASAISYRY